MKPARTVITRAPALAVGAVHATWLQESPIHHEGMLEKSAIEILLLLPGIRLIEHQPFTVVLDVNGVDRKYTPDLRITFDDGSQVVVEVKPRVFVERNHWKFDRCAQLLWERGQSFYVFDDTRIDKQRARRAADFRSLARREVRCIELNRMLGWLHAPGVKTLAAAQAAGFDQLLVGHAIGRRLLTIGPDLNLAPETALRLMESQIGNLHLDRWLGGPPWPTDMATRPSPD